jgi:hypothetical protein
MTAYVDPAVFKKSATGRKSYCHMVADTLAELHSFASMIGIKPHFYHRHRTMPHYDLTAEQRMVAIQFGAQLITSRELCVIAKSAKASLNV